MPGNNGVSITLLTTDSKHYIDFIQWERLDYMCMSESEEYNKIYLEKKAMLLQSLILGAI